MSKNYRKLYKEYYKIDFGNDYEVHHIDLNHNNNDIRNLILLPKTLHRKYHKILYNVTLPIEDQNNVLVNLFHYPYIIEDIPEFVEVIQGIIKWSYFSMYLMTIPMEYLMPLPDGITPLKKEGVTP